MKQVNPFYKSKAWLDCREYVLIRDNYLCQPCLLKKRLTAAYLVHHIKSLEEYPELALNPDNLESSCASCHNKEHPEKGGQGKARKEPQAKRKVKVIMAKGNEEVW